MLQSASLAALADIRHGFFTRTGGVSQGVYASLNGGVGSNDAPEQVAENRARMAQALGVAPERFLTPYQIHSPDVVVADHPWTAETRPRADAIVTREPGLAIGVSTADCGPLLFADAKARVIGAAHAGWRGAFDGVVEATLARMLELGARLDRVAAVVGPCIGKDSYEVGPEFKARFVATDADLFTPSPREGHAMFDLASYVARRLTKAGVARVAQSGGDTCADDALFFSYRRMTLAGERAYGRGLSVIALGI